MNKITVIDSPMGSGKSSFAIQYMRQHPSKIFLYVTPLLTEVDRITASVDNVISCNNASKSKQDFLRDALCEGKSVAITHSLFRQLDPDTVNIINSLSNTCLIIDETLDCYSKIKVSKANIGVMIKEEVIEIVDDGDKKRVVAKNYIKGLSQCDQYWSYIYNKDVFTNDDNELLISMIPCDIYNSVDESFILTYNFEGTDMDCYLKFNGLDFSVNGVRMTHKGVDVTPKSTATGKFYRHLINICDNPKMNVIGERRRVTRQYPLSKSWYTSSNTSPALYKKLGDNCYNFFTHYSKTKAEHNMVTTFKDGSFYEYTKTSDGEIVLSEDFDGKSKGKKSWMDHILKSPFKDTKAHTCFVPFNTRATNDFADKSACAFLIDVHYDYSVKTFFEQYDIHLDNEKYALNTLIQWIWRSRIRKGEPIDLYIPSKRMRHLLMDWLGYSESEKF